MGYRIIEMGGRWYIQKRSLFGWKILNLYTGSFSANRRWATNFHHMYSTPTKEQALAELINHIKHNTPGYGTTIETIIEVDVRDR